MISRTVVLWILLVIGTILVSVQIGLKAEALEDEIRATARAQEVERDRIRVLRASYAYLTAADQLRPLVARHLALEPIRGDQVVTVSDLPRRVPVPARKADEPGPDTSADTPVAGAPRTAEAPRQNHEHGDDPPGTSQNPPWLKVHQNPVLQPVGLPSQKRSSL